MGGRGLPGNSLSREGEGGDVTGQCTLGKSVAAWGGLPFMQSLGWITFVGL